jgi:hypothetical protein
MAKSNSTIRASEIGSFLYCQRSWSYQRQGIQSANVQELQLGTAAHDDHGQSLRWSTRLRSIALTILLLAIILIIIQLIS